MSILDTVDLVLGARLTWISDENNKSIKYFLNIISASCLFTFKFHFGFWDIMRINGKTLVYSEIGFGNIL